MLRRNLVGIDLGTTMSVIAHVDTNGTVATLPNSDGEPLTHSAIYIDGQNVIVGRVAKEAAAHIPDKVATFVKREMGESLYSRRIDGRQFHPETLSAMILRKLKQDAERRLGPVRRAVITVPAFFDDARRKSTQDAGRIAGFETVDVLNEPTAAALSYCLENQLNDSATAPELPGGRLTALVYDLGGGTFDVTMIRLEAQRIDTLATDGAVELGGKDWDDKLVDYVAQQFHKQHGIAVPPERRAMIQNKAETTKKLLSQLPLAEIEHFDQDRSLKVSIQRSQFEEMTRPLLAQTEVITNLIVKKSRLPDADRPMMWSDVDRVLLVGGSTRMPMVRTMLKRVTGKEPDRSLDPDQVVARGAAVFVNMLAARGGDGSKIARDAITQRLNAITVLDVNSHSLGVEVFDPKTAKQRMAILIPQNHHLPCAKSRVFRIKVPGATTVRVPVLEGEAPDPNANIRLGECVITELQPNLPASSPVQVRLSYEPDGRVQVMALDMTGGRFAHAEIHRRSGLSDQQIAQQAEYLRSFDIQ